MEKSIFCKIAIVKESILSLILNIYNEILHVLLQLRKGAGLNLWFCKHKNVIISQLVLKKSIHLSHSTLGPIPLHCVSQFFRHKKTHLAFWPGQKEKPNIFSFPHFSIFKKKSKILSTPENLGFRKPKIQLF